jgi:predicted DNA-binding mobile mystery protein A
MPLNRSGFRRRLELRLEGLEREVGPRPPLGWIRTIREALGMTTFELATRMGVTQSRASQLERAEVDGSLQLSTLERVAAALKCKVCYALVPEEPLEAIVFHQAWEKAASVVARSAPHMGLLVHEATHSEHPTLAAVEVSERIEDLAYDLIDRRGLWVIERPVGGRVADQVADQNVQTSTTWDVSGTPPAPS